MFLSSCLRAPYNCVCSACIAAQLLLCAGYGWSNALSLTVLPAVVYSPGVTFATSGCGWEGTEQRLVLTKAKHAGSYHLLLLNNSGLMLCFAGYGERLSLPVPPWLLWHSLWAQCSDVYRFSVLQWWHMLGKGARGELHLRLPFWLHRVKLWKKSRQVHKQSMCKWWVFLSKTLMTLTHLCFSVQKW